MVLELRRHDVGVVLFELGVQRVSESRICDELLLLGKFDVELPQFFGDFIAAVPYELLNRLVFV